MYKKSQENTFVYDLIVLKALRFRFDRIDGFIRIYDGTRYLTRLN